MYLIFKSDNYLKFILISLVGSISLGCQKTGQSIVDSKNLLPAPQKVEMTSSIFEPDKTEKIYIFSVAGQETHSIAEMLEDQFEKLYGKGLSVESITSKDEISRQGVVLGISGENDSFTELTSQLPSPLNDSDESYILNVSEGLVIISGASDRGLFYGVQTLIQLLEDAKWKDATIAGMRVEDWPDLELRWVHYNYFFHLDRFEYIKESIKKLAKYKINGIVFEFEDTFAYRSYPFVVSPNSFTPEQIRELTQFAHQYYVDIVPLVQGFGHAGYLLKHEELKHLREDPEIYQSFCPLKEETYDFIFDLFEETINATPGVKFFHIGADEVRHMGKCDLCKEKKKEVGDLGLYLTWLDRVNVFMESKGRTVVFWDDMPMKHAGLWQVIRNDADTTFEETWNSGISKLDKIITRFPEDGVFMRWNYQLGREKGNVNILDWYAKNNFKAMAATAVIGDWPLIPKYNWMPANIKSFVSLAAEKGILGELCTAWGDDSGNHFEVYWVGFLAASEYAWSGASPTTLDEYWEKYVYRFFGPDTNGLIEAFHILSERVDFWDSSLMKKGNKRRIGYEHITLPNLDSLPEAGSWVKHYKALFDSARVEKARCIEATAILKKQIGVVKDNAYNLEVFVTMGELMESYTDLVLSIERIAVYCDKNLSLMKDGEEPVKEEYSEMTDRVEEAWNDYLSTYERLKKVWEIARYPKGGEGYMLNDQTHYMAGRTTDLSYLILAEQELDLVGHVRKLSR
ncbi:MAG: hypothetical protein CMJ19_15035 [Phycisphaeraceae bacterium]|nr:hypothetical protein [Phycisphaeraceae bacterium]